MKDKDIPLLLRTFTETFGENARHPVVTSVYVPSNKLEDVVEI